MDKSDLAWKIDCMPTCEEYFALAEVEPIMWALYSRVVDLETRLKLAEVKLALLEPIG